MGLAKSLASNLGLHKPRLCSVIKERQPDSAGNVLGFSIKQSDASATEFNSECLEEWRATAGVFFLGVVYIRITPQFMSHLTDTPFQDLHFLEENRTTSVYASPQNLLRKTCHDSGVRK